MDFHERMIMEKERWSSVSNTYFEHRSLHKYTGVARNHDGGDIRSMIDLVLVKRDLLRYMQDVRAVRGMERGLLDHHVVLRKARIVGAWIKKREVVIGARRIKSEKLTKDRYREGYARSLERKGVECDEDNVEHNWDQMK